MSFFQFICFISFHFIWLSVARQTAEITYLELSRALVGLWLPSHCEEALIALFGMRPVSIPSAWKHIRNMASSGKKERHMYLEYVQMIATSHLAFSYDLSETSQPPTPCTSNERSYHAPNCQIPRWIAKRSHP